MVFDRFFAEEAYSFHFCNPIDDRNNKSNDVLRILDMQDMHSLRYYRQDIIEKRDLDLKSYGCGLDVLQENNIVDDQEERFPTIAVPTRKKSPLEKKNPHDILLRELAAIHRSDLVLVCSQFELNLLRDEYGIKNEKLVLAPFFTKETDRNHEVSFGNRKDFVALGGFKHSPNVDQVMMLKKYIWPKIQEQLKGRVPDLKLHIYGSYPPQKVQQLHNKREGFIVHGYINDLSRPLTQGRVLLAPLRYGAGIKGKIIDAWKYGCPVVTTTIGAEGIGSDISEKGNGWGGSVASDNATFIKEAIRLYTDENEWTRSVSNGRRILKEQFDELHNFEVIDDAILEAMKNINDRRRRDYISAILWRNSFRSTEYFSKWIELKESLHSSTNEGDNY